MGLHSFESCVTVATAKLPGLIKTSLISPHPTLTAIAFQYIIIMIGCPPCSHYDTTLMLLHVINSLWSHQSVPMMGMSLECSLVPNIFLRNHTSYIHDETSDKSANSDLTHIDGHSCVPENDVSITMDTVEFVGEAAEMMDMAADSKIMMFSPTKKALHA
jgi:ABC-type iron transport system FetAB permease component